MKNSKLPIVILLFALFLLSALVMGCDNRIDSSVNESTENVEATEIQNKLTIVASLFPHYDFARAIAGEYADVILILPPGIESHAYEPTPKDIIKITESDEPVIASNERTYPSTICPNN